MSAKRTFTEEQIAFVRERAHVLSTRKLAEEYTRHFGQPIGQTEVRRLMSRNGIQATANPRNDAIPVGTEKWSDYYQCMMIKTHHVDTSGMKDKKHRDYLRNGQWQLKQNYVWEKENGKKLPWRTVVVFLDGDRRNYSPDNLYAVPLNVAGTIEKMRMHSESAEIYKTALIWGELYYALK